MNSRPFTLFSLLLSLLFLKADLHAQVLEWTGAGDGISLYKENNWRERTSHEIPADGSIDKNKALQSDLLVESGNVGGRGFGANLWLGGHTLTIKAGAVIGATEAGIGSYTGKGNVMLSGGQLSCGFLENIVVKISNNAKLTLKKASSLINTSIDIHPSLTGSIELYGMSKTEVETNILPLITLDGETLVLGTDVFLSSTEKGTEIALNERADYGWDAVPTGNKDYSDNPVSNDGPNIIFILLDDLGYGDLGNFWQNQLTGDKKMATPMLDKMANEGCMMTNHYCPAPVCAPSRASFLQGLHQGHANVRNNQFDKPLADDLTIANVLQSAGYRTMHIGKNGVAGGKDSGNPAHPLLRGFDQFFGYLYHAQGHEHYPLNGTTEKKAFFFDGYREIKVGTDLTYTTDVFTAKAKQYIADHQSNRPEQPFFMYLAYDVPHFRLQKATQAYPEGYGINGGVQWTGYENPDGTLVETPWVNTASGVRDSYVHSDYADKDWNRFEKAHASMIRRVDNGVEDIIQTLRDLNIDDNTIIVFSSDNGPHNIKIRPTAFQSFADMTGMKRDVLEGGLKVPTIVRYPGKIPAGSEVSFNSGFWDWLPTFADVADAPIPAKTDGVSLMPSLTQNDGQVDKGYSYVEYSHGSKTPGYGAFGDHAGRRRKQMQVIKFGKYKGLRYNIKTHEDDFEIYDISVDHAEANNLAGDPSFADLQQQMKDKVLQVRKADASAKRPYDNELIPAVDIAATRRGLAYKYYEGVFPYVPDFDYLTAVSSGYVKNIDFSVAKRDNQMGLMFSGYITVPADGAYTFYLQSGSNVHLKIHDIHLLTDDYNFKGDEISATLNLKAGTHPIKMFYQNNKALTNSLSLQLEGPEIEKAPIPDDMFNVEVTATTPTNKSKIANEIGFNIYPSPVKENLHLSFEGRNSSNYQVVISNMIGNTVHRQQIIVDQGLNTVDLNVKGLNEGIYLIALRDQQGNLLYRHKFIKKD